MVALIKLYLRSLAVVGFHAGVALSFYGLVEALSHLFPATLRPCNDGCTFIRYWGSQSMPRSAEGCLPHARSGAAVNPVFVTVKNGDVNFTTSGEATLPEYVFEYFPKQYAGFVLDVARWGRVLGAYVHLAADLNVESQSTNGSFPSPVCKSEPAASRAYMARKCDALDMKKRAAQNNHLKGALTLPLYSWSLAAWALLMILHDWCLIWDHPEKVSLALGFFAFLAQISAVCFGFVWAVGAAEVFEATDRSGCTCYFELDFLFMAAAISTQVGLYFSARSKLWKLGYAVLHGDSVFSIHYTVPHRAANHCSSDPFDDFLSPQSMLASDGWSAPPTLVEARMMVPHEYKFCDACFQCCAELFNISALCVVYPLAFEALTVRMFGFMTVDIHARLSWPHFVADIGGALLGACIGAAAVWSVNKQRGRFCEFLTTVNVACKGRNAGAWILKMLDRRMLMLLTHAARAALSSMSSLFSLYLAWALWQREAVTAASAERIGAAGFYFMAGFLSAYQPSDTHLRDLRQATAVKSGQVPLEGLSRIIDLNKKYPHLGLHKEAALCRTFQEQDRETPLDYSLVDVDIALQRRWQDFREEQAALLTDRWRDACRRFQALPVPRDSDTEAEVDRKVRYAPSDDLVEEHRKELEKLQEQVKRTEEALAAKTTEGESMRRESEQQLKALEEHKEQLRTMQAALAQRGRHTRCCAVQ